ncbi:crossover junction endodeoxyribonuclease RuvC [Acuticoccus sp.]|uniref:crossover junction endodeoxyribonuclease RuvC n=1 Tax=Acuticoccus sp. TaxID=1904378 RepID=UPI003B520CA3
MVTILGLDPGLRATGWGAIAVEGPSLSFVGAGTVRSSAEALLGARLAALYDGLSLVVADLAPDEAAAETTYVSRDGAATLKLGQARGVALLVPAVRGIPVSEYAPSLVKKSVVGAGRADKRQIKAMVTMLLPAARGDTEHAWDALAVAICHASHRRSRSAASGRAAA